MKRLGKVVVVGTPEKCPVLALDFHRVTRKVGGEAPERPTWTRSGQRVVWAKYGGGTPVSVNERTALTEQLATVIDTHPSYRSAACIAAVPGRLHDFSTQLGKDVSGRVNKPFVSLRAQPNLATEEPRFVVDDVSEIQGRSVIVLDDVYRSGLTLQAAAMALRGASAAEVLGLTVTCTISAMSSPCAHDGVN